MATPVPYPLMGDMRLLCCNHCGFLGTQTSSNTTDYANYYTNYNKHQTREGAVADLDRQYFKKVIGFIRETFPLAFEGARVLDFGSGAKLFSTMAKDAGSASASNFDLQEPINGKTFDLIVSTHCFEHIFDFNVELTRIRDTLVEDGLFCIAVPDIRGYSEYYYGPYNCFDLEHINHFDHKSLSEALRRNGLIPIALMESDRLVTATLAYPEVVIVAKRQDSPTSGKIEYCSNRYPISAVMKSYMSASYLDMAAALKFIQGIFERNTKDCVKAAYGIYGLSSYAFRVLHRWDTRMPLQWLADSDRRLAGKTIGQTPIFDFDEFRNYVKVNAVRGTRTVCFVAAVNAYRIETYLRSLGMKFLDIYVIPPNCQNRIK
jgi:SAM-dependent methyltransferase